MCPIVTIICSYFSLKPVGIGIPYLKKWFSRAHGAHLELSGVPFNLLDCDHPGATQCQSLQY